MTRNLLVLALFLAVLTPANAGPISGRARYLDGGAPRELTRLGPRDESGRAAVSLTHPRTGAAIFATLGDEALVQLRSDATPEALAELGLTPVRQIAPGLHIWQVRGHAGEDGLDVAARLASTPARAVAGAIPDLAFPHVRAATAFVPPPNDPRYDGQWFFARLGMNEAWARQTGEASTTIVVVDDGCDLAHPDLAFDPGFDAYAMDNDPSYAPGVAGNNHGTACAGLIAARTNNGLGVAGACPGCKLRCVRLLGGDGVPVPMSSDIAAFQFALDVGAAVVSNSWGYKQALPVPDMLRQMLEKLYDTGRGGLGAIAVFAAGNDDRLLNDDEINAVRGVVTVGAVNNFSQLTSYSNYGPSVAVVAPTGTLSTDISGPEGGDPGDYISNFGGTSSACPIVAGILGLMVSTAPTRSASALVDALLASARQSPFANPDATGHDDYYGHGEVRPLDALRLLSGEVLDAGTADQGVAMMQDEAGCACDYTPGAPRLAPLAALLVLAALHRARARGLKRRRPFGGSSSEGPSETTLLRTRTSNRAT